MAIENPSGQAPEEGTPAPSLTEEDVGRIVNSAVTAHLKRSLPSAIQEGLSSLNIAETIGAEVAKLAPQPDAKPDPDGKATPVNPQFQKQLEEMAAKFEASQKDLETERQNRLAVEQARQNDAALTAFRSAVAQKIRPDMLDVFVDHYGGKILSVNEDGSPVLTLNKAPFKGAPEEPTAMALDDSSIQLLLAQKNVAPFLPAPGGQQGGGGTRRPQAGVPAGDIPAGEAAKANHVLQVLEGMGVDPNALF